MDAKVVTLWCRSCLIGFAVRGAWPPSTLHSDRTKAADWSLENPTPLKPYNLNANDYRFLRSLRIGPG